MRNITILLLLVYGLFFFGPGLSYAQNLYVSDEIKITMRTGPGNDYKVIAVLSTGTALELIEEKEDWLHVRSDPSKEGWILKRFTSDETPKKIQIEQLQKKIDNLSNRLQELTEQASEMGKENINLKQTLASSQSELNRLRADYSSLAADSKDVLDLKRKYEESAANVIEFISVTDQLRQENADLRSTSNVRWFLIGAGVVASSLSAGFILGKTRRGRRRKPVF